MKHLRYLGYLVTHKLLVLVAGLITGAPLWRLLIHDWSKFTPLEWQAYVAHFYGQRTLTTEVRFKNAVNVHHARNLHHWQNWVGKFVPDPVIREMVADWAAFERQQHGAWSPFYYWTANKPSMKFHPLTNQLVDKLVRRFHGKRAQ